MRPGNQNLGLAVITLAITFLNSACSKAPETTVSSWKIAAPSAGCYIGAFANGMNNIASFETVTGRKLAVVMWYVNWTEDFPTADIASVEANRSLPMITWEPWNGLVTTETYTLTNILNGNFDSYITRFAEAAKNFSYPLYLRFAHEMNSTWYPWAGYLNGSSEVVTGESYPEGPRRYIAAWKRVYNLFSQAGATNVTWVWSPTAKSVPYKSWNSLENYYPGDDYVDWIGIDGYNWGTVQSGTSWQTFSAIFDEAYSTLTVSHPSKPLMIAEFASTELGGAKSSWITDAFSQIRNNYPRIKLFNWFNLNKETDWRVNSSSSAEAAFKTAVSQSYFLERAAW